MTDIVSSLEHEFADRSQAARESKIAELKKIAAAGTGSVDVVPHAIVLPAGIGIVGLLFIYASLTTAKNGPIAFLCGAVLVAYSAWALFYPRKPRFTLTEQGVRVREVLLPWSSIEDYNVTLHTTNGISTQTTITLKHPADYVPQKLGLFYAFGRSFGKGMLRTQPITNLMLYPGAKGMNHDKLAQRIGEFRAAFHARAELARLQAN